jgi:hypothetical protein
VCLGGGRGAPYIRIPGTAGNCGRWWGGGWGQRGQVEVDLAQGRRRGETR